MVTGKRVRLINPCPRHLGWGLGCGAHAARPRGLKIFGFVTAMILYCIFVGWMLAQHLFREENATVNLIFKKKKLDAWAVFVSKEKKKKIHVKNDNNEQSSSTLTQTWHSNVFLRTFAACGVVVI